MVDRQRFIYDLSLHCAVLEVQRDYKLTDYLPAKLLEAFTSAANAYNAMNDDAITAALKELNKALP